METVKDRIIAAARAAEPRPLVIMGETAKQLAIYSALSGIPAQKVAEFLLGRSADQLLQTDGDSFGCDVADMLGRPQDARLWLDAVQQVAA